VPLRDDATVSRSRPFQRATSISGKCCNKEGQSKSAGPRSCWNMYCAEVALHQALQITSYCTLKVVFAPVVEGVPVTGVVARTL
jgi:hypothetical protein